MTTDATTARPRATVLEFAAYAVASLVLLWPVTLHLSTRVVGAPGGDAPYYVWLTWRWGRLLAGGHVFTHVIPDVVYPFGFDLRYVDGHLPTLFTAFVNVFIGPVLAYNLCLAFGIFTNFVAARHLGRVLSERRVVWVLTAFAFATSPAVMMRAQLGHLPLMYAFTVPLLVADAVRVARDDAPVRWLRLAVLLALAFLCSVYYLVFGGLAYLLIVGVAAIRERRWTVFARVALGGAVALVALSPLVVARVQLDRSERAAGAPADLTEDAQALSPDVLGVVVPPSRATLGFPVLDRLGDRRLMLPSPAVEGSVFPGLALIAGFAVFLFVRTRLRWPVVVAVVVTWVLSFGPSARWRTTHHLVNKLPYRALLKLPALGSLRVPERTGVVLAALLAVAFAVALDRYANRAVTVVAVALLVTNLIVPLPWSLEVPDRAAREAFTTIRAERGPRDTVIRVPADCDFLQAEFAKTQIVHHAPIVGCTGSFAAARWYTRLVRYVRSPAFNALRCDLTQYGRLQTPGMQPVHWDAGALRREFGVRYLVVDPQALRVPACPDVARVVASLRDARVLARDGSVEVIDLGAAAARRP